MLKEYTKRENKEITIKNNKKEYIKLHKRLNELYQIRRNLGYEKLKIPEFTGWKKYFILRNDIKNSDKNIQLERILKVINDEVFCKRKDFKIYNRKEKKYEIFEPKLQYLEISKFEKFIKEGKLSEEDRKYFQKVKRIIGWYFKREIEVYEFIYQWMFITIKKKHFITEKKILDEILEKEINYIFNKLFNRDMLAYKYSERSMKSDRDYYSDTLALKNKVNKKLIKNEINDYNNEEQIK
jgi:hypothetical protein